MRNVSLKFSLLLESCVYLSVCVCVCVEKETCSDSKLTPRPQLLPKAVSISLEGPLFGVTHLK